jgi:release factor glutamine methyltransferase
MKPLTITALLDAARQALQGTVEEPVREAQALICAVTGLSRAALFARADEPVDASIWQRCEQALDRRCAGEPLAYIVGRRGFWTLDLEVTPAVLVPRPESELLVERALRHGDAAADGGEPCRVLDLGTGSGAIALAIASERPAWRVTGVDLSGAALAVALRNAQRHGLARVRLLEGSWFEPVADERFEIVVANPPYVAAEDAALNDPALLHEPRLALTPGPDALAALRQIAQQAPAHLAAGGWLLLEHGAGQGIAVRALLEARGYAHVGSHCDLAGHERVTEGRWSGDPAGQLHR